MVFIYSLFLNAADFILYSCRTTYRSFPWFSSVSATSAARWACVFGGCLALPNPSSSFSYQRCPEPLRSRRRPPALRHLAGYYSSPAREQRSSSSGWPPRTPSESSCHPLRMIPVRRTNTTLLPASRFQSVTMPSRIPNSAEQRITPKRGRRHAPFFFGCAQTAAGELNDATLPPTGHTGNHTPQETTTDGICDLVFK